MKPVVSVIIPTVSGREQSLERCREAYRKTLRGVPAEIIVVRDRPTCSEAANDGVAKARGSLVHNTADDLEPHPGWLDAGMACLERGVLPSAYLLLPDGVTTDGGVGPDGSEAAMAPIPIVPRDEWVDWPKIHYWGDVWWSAVMKKRGWSIEWCHAFRFTHHRVQDNHRRRMERRFTADRAAFISAMQNDQLEDYADLRFLGVGA